MTLLTNKKGLPHPIVEAIKHDSYKVNGDISVTTLIDSPKIRILKKMHHHEIESDVSEYLWALMGTMVHSILERSHIKDIRKRAFLTVIETLKDESKNRREEDKLKLEELSGKIFSLIPIFFPEIENRYVYELTFQYDYNGMLLYGTFDLYDKEEKCLYDYKVCSVYAYLYPESRKKWSTQTNIYSFLLRENGYEVNAINIVAIFRDWSAMKAQTSSDYPEDQFMIIPINVLPHEKVREYIHKRMELHKGAGKGIIPDCTGEERWGTADEYAVKPPHLKRAIKKFLTEKEAQNFIDSNKYKYEKGLELIIRPGENKRCEKYCVVRDFCEQRKRNNN